MNRPFAPGSIGWLLHHELRLTLRRSGSAGYWSIVILAAMLVVLAVTAGVPLALAMGPGPLQPTPEFSLAVAGAAIFGGAMMLSQSLAMTVQAFFERGDFDLLFSSPLPPSRVLFVRAAAIIIPPALLYGALLTPFLLPVALFVDAHLFAAYLVLLATALLAGALGLGLAMGLFVVLGPRRTKVVGQILVVLIGAGFIAAIQIPQLFSGGQAELGRAALLSWFPPGGLLSWPGAAALGAAKPLLILLGTAVLAFWGQTRLIGARFGDMAVAAQGRDAPRLRRADAPLKAFSDSLPRAMIRKEWRLILRDPGLISLVLIRVLYFTLIVAVLLRHVSVSGVPVSVVAGGAAAAVLMASQVAGSLIWIVINAEDARDLIASAPVTASQARRAKLTAALAPVAVLVGVPALVLLPGFPREALAMAVMAFFACYSACYVNLWYEKPEPRSSFRRRGHGSLVATLSELFLGFAFMPVTVLAAVGSLWAVPFTLLPIGLLGLLYLGRRNDV